MMRLEIVPTEIFRLMMYEIQTMEMVERMMMMIVRKRKRRGRSRSRRILSYFTSYSTGCLLLE